MIKRFHLEKLLQNDYCGKTYWYTKFEGIDINIEVSLNNIYVYPVDSDAHWIYVSVYMWRHHLIPFSDLNDRAVTVHPLKEKTMQCTLDCVVYRFDNISIQLQQIIRNLKLQDNPRDIFFLQNVALTLFW